MSLKFIVKYFYDIILVVLLLLVFNYYMSYKGIRIVDRKVPIKETTEFTMEGMEGMEVKKKEKKQIDILGENSFCEKYNSNPENLEKKCNEINRTKCENMDCCVYAYNKKENNNKCVAGYDDGPLFNKNNYQNWFFKDKCFGERCN